MHTALQQQIFLLICPNFAKATSVVKKCIRSLSIQSLQSTQERTYSSTVREKLPFVTLPICFARTEDTHSIIRITLPRWSVMQPCTDLELLAGCNCLSTIYCHVDDQIDAKQVKLLQGTALVKQFVFTSICSNLIRISNKTFAVCTSYCSR